MASVWVCKNRPQVAQKDTKNCDHIRSDGSCSCYGISNRKPCDAVEYIPKDKDSLLSALEELGVNVQSQEQTDARCDLSYVNGVRAGWNAVMSAVPEQHRPHGDRLDAFLKSVENTRAEARKAIPPAPKE
jgi:hypothetical protein